MGSGSLHAEVEKQLETETQTGRVIFTGAVAHHRVPTLLDACDILVAPHIPLADGSDFFGSPTKIFEYMAMEKRSSPAGWDRSVKCLPIGDSVAG